MSQEEASRRSPLQLALALALVAAMIFVGFYPTQAQQPSNDTWEGATEITGLPYSNWQDTTEATVSFDDPYSGCVVGGTPTNTVWYKFTPASTVNLRAHYRESSFIIKLGVYTHSDFGFEEISCASGENAEVQFTAEAGTNYYFMLGAIGDGSYPPPVPGGMLHFVVQEILAPTNDNFTDARWMQTMPYEEYVDITAASVETNEPTPSCAYDGSYRTIWYAYSPTANAELQIETPYAWGIYPFVSIWSGDSITNLSELGCQRSSPLKILVRPGQTYYIQAGSSYPEDLGVYHLIVKERLIPPPPNDNFVNARAVTDPNYFDYPEVTYASVEPGEPMASCIGGEFYQTVWYAFSQPVDSLLALDIWYPNVPSFKAVWMGTDLGNLTEIGCQTGQTLRVRIQAGQTYYIQVGALAPGATGESGVNFSCLPIPPNDDFASAQPIEILPFSYDGASTFAATSQEGEPTATCAYSGPQHTVWFSYTAAESRSVMVSLPGWFYHNFVAVYSGDSLGSLSEVRCEVYLQDRPLVFNAEAGKTYSLQLGSLYEWDYGTYTFNLDYAPSPTASFWFWPSDASIYDSVTFYSSSYDPIYGGFSGFWWDFGDGATATDNPAMHQYTADGDYTVWHKVQTPDGRTAETTQVVQIRTHDIGIAKFNVPKSANGGQTRSIVVGLSNIRYTEVVEVELWKSVPGGYAFVGRLKQTVPVRPANRTTEYSFNYTFTAEDAAMGKVTFKAIAYLQGYRDALPGDNEVNAPPTKVGR